MSEAEQAELRALRTAMEKAGKAAHNLAVLATTSTMLLSMLETGDAPNTPVNRATLYETLNAFVDQMRVPVDAVRHIVETADRIEVLLDVG
jgi:hypothetical protein